MSASDTPSVPHGTTNGYYNYACRCDECREAHVERMRRYRSMARGWRPIEPTDLAPGSIVQYLKISQKERHLVGSPLELVRVASFPGDWIGVEVAPDAGREGQEWVLTRQQIEDGRYVVPWSE